VSAASSVSWTFSLPLWFPVVPSLLLDCSPKNKAGLLGFNLRFPSVDLRDNFTVFPQFKPHCQILNSGVVQLKHLISTEMYTGHSDMGVNHNPYVKM